nr:uncharacterized protein LOC109180987 isoform X2 [Ipomoea batatas]
MALRQLYGFSDGEVMRSDCPRITVPRSLRWAACGAVSTSSTTALLVRRFSPECEPQDIAAYDKKDSAAYSQALTPL